LTLGCLLPILKKIQRISSKRFFQKHISMDCKKLLCKLPLLGIYLLIALIPLAVGVVRPGISGYRYAMLEDMIYGNAYTPFVKRQLVPLVVRAGTACFPSSLQQWCRDAFAHSSIVKRLGWPPAYASEFLLSLLVMYGCVVSFLIVLRIFLTVTTGLTSAEAHSAALMTGATLPFTFSGRLYLYDFAQLMLFTSGLILLFRKRWLLFYPVYILSCINKETSILLPIVFLCWKGRHIIRPQYFANLVSQFIIGGGIIFYIARIFQNNPGSNAYWMLERNLTLDFSPLAWMRLIILLLGIVFAVWRIRVAPLFLSRGFLATAPVLIVATLFFGYIDELRDYYEALPFMIGLCLFTAGKGMGKRTPISTKVSKNS
jgi:hypothetical protein